MTTLTEYQKRAVIQSREWVAGNTQHERVNNECTPDFSCCHPELFEQDRSRRQRMFNDLLIKYGLEPELDS